MKFRFSSVPYIVWSVIFVVVPLILVAVFYIGNEARTALTETDNVSQLSHIIGGVCGGLLGFFLDRRR